MKNVISTDKAPAAIGPYSQAIEVNGMVYTSGIIPVVPSTGEIPEGSVAQAKQAFENLSNLLAAAGTSMDKVVKTTVFIKEMNDFGAINEVMGLSRAMSLFFEAFVENLIFSNKELNVENKNLKTIDNWKDKITVIYAGGDDTFIVGRYDEVFEFSQLLRDTFRKYVGNDGITFSAGVGMFNAN